MQAVIYALLNTSLILLSETDPTLPSALERLAAMCLAKRPVNTDGWSSYAPTTPYGTLEASSLDVDGAVVPGPIVNPPE